MIRSTRLLAVAIVVMLTCGAVEVSGVRTPGPSSPSIAVPSLAPLTPMRTAVSLVDGQPLRDGRLLSARTRRVLDAHAFPAQLRLNGQPVERGELVPVDARVEVVPGRDRVEPLAQRRSSASPLVTVKGKQRLVRPRVVVVTVGSVSGEELKRTVVMAPPPQRKHRGSVLLTFDDGPDPAWTPQVLALLRQRKVHAVFCVVGREARKHADLLRQIVREGHLLCDHTQDHDERLRLEAPDVSPASQLSGRRRGDQPTP